MAKAPASLFYWSDWVGSSDLAKCSLAANGAWIWLLARMHENDRQGFVEGTLEELAKLVPASSADEFKAVLIELIRHGVATVFTVDEDGVDLMEFGRYFKPVCDNVTLCHGLLRIYNRRMRRDSKARKSSAERQRDSRKRKASRESHKKVTTPLSYSSSISEYSLVANEQIRPDSEPQTSDDLPDDEPAKPEPDQNEDLNRSANRDQCKADRRNFDEFVRIWNENRVDPNSKGELVKANRIDDPWADPSKRKLKKNAIGSRLLKRLTDPRFTDLGYRSPEDFAPLIRWLAGCEYFNGMKKASRGRKPHKASLTWFFHPDKIPILLDQHQRMKGAAKSDDGSKGDSLEGWR